MRGKLREGCLSLAIMRRGSRCAVNQKVGWRFLKRPRVCSALPSAATRLVRRRCPDSGPAFAVQLSRPLFIEEGER
jgi:hypothetical protein